MDLACSGAPGGEVSTGDVELEVVVEGLSGAAVSSLLEDHLLVFSPSSWAGGAGLWGSRVDVGAEYPAFVRGDV